MFLQKSWTAVLLLFYLQASGINGTGRFWELIVPTFSRDPYLITEGMIRSTINTKIQPCEDFFSYACGNFSSVHPSKLYNDITSFVDRLYNKQIKDLFDENFKFPYQGEKYPSFAEQAKLYLKSCLAQTQRNLTRYFDDIKPAPQTNWPILEQLTVKSYQPFKWPGARDTNVWSLLGKLQSYGMQNVIINHEILTDKEGDVSVILAPFESVEDNTLPDVDILNGLLMSLGVENPAHIINGLRKTNGKLVNMRNNLNSAEATTIEINYGDIERTYPKLSLTSYLSELLGRELPADTVISLKYPEYFQNLNDNQRCGTRKESLCNYLMMKFLYFLAVDSTAEFNNKACVTDLRRKMDLAVSFIYYYYKPVETVKPEITEMFYTIVDNLANNIRSNNLKLRNYQLKSLLNKLEKVRLNIGNLPEDATFERIQHFYSKVPLLDEKNYYKNHLLLLKHRFTKSTEYKSDHTYLVVPDNELGSASTPFYVVQQNMIVLPFASLTKPMYDANYSTVTKYSILGFVVAHELAHAFDSNGLYFDGAGEFVTHLSSVLENANFQNSLQCIQEQLPTDSIDELLADITAIQIIENILAKKSANFKPGEVFMDWRRFLFLCVAQFFCNKDNAKNIDHDADSDRLHLIVKNAVSFSEAFQCSKANKLNPADKCRIY